MNKNGYIALFAAVAVMVALTLVREIYFSPIPDLIPNCDSAWLIYAAGRLLDGQKLYVDILETNPPLIVWLSALPVWLARVMGGSPFTIAVLLVTLLDLCSLYLVAKLSCAHKVLGQKFNFSVVILYFAFGLFLLTPALYGQRETLFIALVLPYLLGSLPLESCPRRTTRLLIVAMAALGFAIKPFFMLLWGMNELAVAVERRSIRSLFAWHNWMIGGVQLVYFAAIYVFTPEYITAIFPALRVTYFTFNAPWPHVLEPIAVIGGVLAVLLWLAKFSRDYWRVVWRVVVWFSACVGLMLVQRKDWLNHEYPMVFMAGLVMLVALMYLCGEWRTLRLDIGHRKFVSLCLVVGVFASCVYVDVYFTYKILTKSTRLSQHLLAEIHEKAAGKYIYPLVFNIQPSFPSIALSDGIFRGGFHQLWPLLGVIVREQQGDASPEFLRVKQWFFDSLVGDFTHYPPEFVWVNENVGLEKIAGYAIAPENVDIISVLVRDKRFADLWKNYVQYGEIVDVASEEDAGDAVDLKEKKEPARYALYVRKKPL